MGQLKKMSLREKGHFEIDRSEKVTPKSSTLENGSLRNRSLWKMSHLEIHNFEKSVTSKSITSKMGQFENWSVPKWVTSKMKDWPFQSDRLRSETFFEVVDFEFALCAKLSRFLKWS